MENSINPKLDNLNIMLTPISDADMPFLFRVYTCTREEELAVTPWSDEEKHQFLIDEGVDYVWYGRKAKELGSFNPATKDYLEEVFSNSQVKIYKLL